MVIVENYPNAYKEVYVILKNMNTEAVEVIPDSFMNMLKNNMNKNYEFEIKDGEDIENKNLLKETKVILAYIFLNYWGTEEQNAKIKLKFKQDLINEKENKYKYESNDFFNNKNNLNNKNNEETQLIEVKKDNIFIKLLNSIKSFFKRK